MEKYELNVEEGYILKGYIWNDVDSPKGSILLCHGMAEHIERYEELATFLNKNGYIVFGYNQRGHGETAGSVEKLGYMSDIDNFDALVEDLYKNALFAKDKYPNLKLFLLGHSMGSFVSQRFIEKYSDVIDGCVLSGSALNKGLLFAAGRCISSIITLFRGRHFKSKLLDKLSFGSYNNAFKPNRTAFDWLSTNEENVDKYIADPYCGTIFTCSYFKDLLKNFKVIAKNFNSVRKDLPIYIVSGALDPVSSAGKTVKTLEEEYKKNGINDVSLKLYDGMRHEILNETIRDTVYIDILTFLNNH